MKIRVKSKLRASIFALTVYYLILTTLWTTPIGEKIADFLFEGSTIYCYQNEIDNAWWKGGE